MYLKMMKIKKICNFHKKLFPFISYSNFEVFCQQACSTYLLFLKCDKCKHFYIDNKLLGICTFYTKYMSMLHWETCVYNVTVVRFLPFLIRSSFNNIFYIVYRYFIIWTKVQNM